MKVVTELVSSLADSDPCAESDIKYATTDEKTERTSFVCRAIDFEWLCVTATAIVFAPCKEDEARVWNFELCMEIDTNVVDSFTTDECWMLAEPVFLAECDAYRLEDELLLGLSSSTVYEIKVEVVRKCVCISVKRAELEMKFLDWYEAFEFPRVIDDLLIDAVTTAGDSEISWNEDDAASTFPVLLKKVLDCVEYVGLTPNDDDWGEGITSEPSGCVADVEEVLNVVSFTEVAIIEAIDEELTVSESNDKTKRVPFVDKLENTVLLEIFSPLLTFRFFLENVFHLKKTSNKITKEAIIINNFTNVFHKFPFEEVNGVATSPLTEWQNSGVSGVLNVPKIAGTVKVNLNVGLVNRVWPSFNGP